MQLCSREYPSCRHPAFLFFYPFPMASFYCTACTSFGGDGRRVETFPFITLFAHFSFSGTCVWVLNCAKLGPADGKNFVWIFMWGVVYYCHIRKWVYVNLIFERVKAGDDNVR